MSEMRDYVRQRANALKSRALGEADEVRDYARSFLTSRVGMAVAGALFIAFGSQSVFAPERFPPLGRVGLVEAGLIAPPPSVKLADVVNADDLGITDSEIDTQVNAAKSAAKPYLVRAWEKAQLTLPWLIPALNVALALLSGALLIYTMTLQAKRRGAA